MHGFVEICAMADAVKKLRDALDEFLSQPRPRAMLLRAVLLRNAMEDLKKALPSAFDPKNEKKKGPYEQEAFKLHGECEEALQATPKKRGRGAEGAEAKAEPKCASLHLHSIVPVVILPALWIRHERPDKKRKSGHVAKEEAAAPGGEEGEAKSEDAMDIDEPKG